MKKFTVITPTDLLIVGLILLGMSLTSCSEEADPAPAARVAFTDADTDARYKIDANEFALFLLGADTLTFTSIVPNPERIGTFDFDAVEGTPGKFKNASLYQDGQQEQGLSAGRLTITAFSGDFIEFAYTVTFRTGKRLDGVYSGQIRPIE